MGSEQGRGMMVTKLLFTLKCPATLNKSVFSHQNKLVKLFSTTRKNMIIINLLKEMM
jgi:hypothetical protein